MANSIQTICEQIKNEALEPAKIEAHRIIEKAKEEAERIRVQTIAEIEAEKTRSLQLIEKEKALLNASIEQAIKHGIDKLKFEIVGVFNDLFRNDIETETSKPETIARLIEAICESVKKEGIFSQVGLTVGKWVDPARLAQELKLKLIEAPLSIGAFNGGVQIKLQDKHLTIDVSDRAVKELFASYLKRADLRALVFKE